MNDFILIIILLPIIFMLHEFEEIICFKPWIDFGVAGDAGCGSIATWRQKTPSKRGKMLPAVVVHNACAVWVRSWL